MNEVIEYIVKRAPHKEDAFAKGGMIALCIILVAVLLLMPSAWTLLFLVAGIILTVIIFKNLDLEYEYMLMEDELTIDKIISKSNRRQAGVFNFNRLELMTKADSSELLQYDNKKYKVMDFSSGLDTAVVYAAIVMHENEMVKLLFEPNQAMLDVIKKTHPRNVGY